MSKVYKLKDKLVVYIPFDVMNTLGIKEGDEVDFFKYSDKSFMFARKDYITDLLTQLKPQQPMVAMQQPQVAQRGDLNVNEKELAILKKLDTLRYNDRTREKVDSLLNADEKQLLQILIKRKYISLYKKSNEQSYKYGISKSVYDQFLYRKNQAGASSPQQSVQIEVQRPAPKWEQRLSQSNSSIDLLESKGYLVLMNEADASNVSAALEDSIRHGLVLGTRAFNKKFYIALRAYINRHAPKILEAIGTKPLGASEIARLTGIDEDGIRAILYIMSEAGDVTEVRRDIFKAA